MTVRGGGRAPVMRFRVRSVVQRRKGARQVNGTMASAGERRGEKCVCKCVSKVGLRKRGHEVGDGRREGEPEARAMQ